MFVHYSGSILNDLSRNRMTIFEAHNLGAAGQSVMNDTKVPALLTAVS